MSDIKELNLSYHAYKNYKECPLKHYALNVKRIKPKRMQDEYNTLFGSVVQKVFENFYNQEIYKSGSKTRDILKDSVPGIFKKILKYKYVDWSKYSDTAREDLIQECIDVIDQNVDVIKNYKLIGEYARSEVKTYSWINKYNKINGRIDFVIQRNGAVTILDGKGSKFKGKYIDKLQLFWYALSYYLYNKIMPKDVYMWYYRFPEDPLQKFEFTPKDLMDLKTDIIKVCWDIHSNKWGATPSSKSCKFCPFDRECKFKNDYFNKNKSLVKNENGGIILLDIDEEEE
jgi:acyl-CoA-binding protein